MTETVFDVACPNPLTLKEMSSLAIVTQLWRGRIHWFVCRRRKLTPSSLHNLCSGIVNKNILPNMPQEIYDLLNKYVTPRLEDSLVTWLCTHAIKVFVYSKCLPDGWYGMLRKFHDFELDWDGTIHEVRTAKRMLQCDEVTIQQKFRVACLYCFEDDIKRIWPSVCSEIDLNELGFEFYQQVYYWTCFLRNELHKIPNRYDEDIDDMMLFESESKNYSCALYFWNRLSSEKKTDAIYLFLEYHRVLFLRFILPKLSESQLDEFITHEGARTIVSELIYNKREDRCLVLPIWMYIRNKIEKSDFISLIKKLLTLECDWERDEQLKYQSKVPLCCEIWSSAAQSLKQSVIDDVLLESKYWSLEKSPSTTMPRETRFLLTVLSDASFEERSVFWSKHWPSLISGTRVQDLLEIMKLCFRNEEEISLFKENTMFKYENLAEMGGYLEFMEAFSIHHGISRGISEMNIFFSFCNSDPLKRMELKRRILHDRGNCVHGLLSENPEFVNEFLNDKV